jgi:hypothetical protein
LLRASLSPITSHLSPFTLISRLASRPAPGQAFLL